jgi:hypothetical protein
VAKTQIEIDRWARGERQRIEQEAEEKAKAEKIQAGRESDSSPSGRLSRLKQKIMS